jgi:hypothetical protein
MTILNKSNKMDTSEILFLVFMSPAFIVMIYLIISMYREHNDRKSVLERVAEVPKGNESNELSDEYFGLSEKYSMRNNLLIPLLLLCCVFTVLGLLIN